jgi:hypothetical protein
MNPFSAFIQTQSSNNRLHAIANPHCYLNTPYDATTTVTTALGDVTGSSYSIQFDQNSRPMKICNMATYDIWQHIWANKATTKCCRSIVCGQPTLNPTLYIVFLTA